MPDVKRTAAGRISAVFDRPSRDAKERVRANDPELLKFLGLAPTQSVDTPPVDAVLESYDSVEPQIDDPYVPPPAYDDALYDESQVFVNAGKIAPLRSNQNRNQILPPRRYATQLLRG